MMAEPCLPAIWWSQWRASNADNYLAAARSRFPCFKFIPKGSALLISRVLLHYNDAIMRAMTSQITGLTIVYSTFNSGTVQSSASLAFVWGIHRWPMNSPHKGPVTRKCFHLMTSSCQTFEGIDHGFKVKRITNVLQLPGLFCVVS